MRLGPPGHQGEKGESQRHKTFAGTIAGQNVRLDSAEHLEKDSGVSPFPESREVRPEQSAHCENFPDSDDVQDISWIAERADFLYDIRKMRKVHEGPRRDFQDKNGRAGYVNRLSVHSRLSDLFPDSGFNTYYGQCRWWLQSLDSICEESGFIFSGKLQTARSPQ
jgi:hypothetical protein